MSRRSSLALRMALLAYPAGFRRDYGREWMRSVEDLHRHAQVSTPDLVVRVFVDVLVTAPTMRFETIMETTTRIAPILGAGIALVALIIVAPPAAIAAVTVVTVLVVLAHRQRRPIAAVVADQARHWYVWLVGGAVLFALGLAVLAVSERGAGTATWATWVISWGLASIVTVLGLGLGAARLVDRRKARL